MSSLRNLFGKVWATGEGFRTNCPRCNDVKGKLHINEEKGVGCCFHADCAWHYSRGGVTAYQLRAYFGGREVSYTTVIPVAEEADVSLPEEFKPLRKLKSSLRETLLAYLEGRGLKSKVIYDAQVGYCERGRFWGYLVFPVFNEDGEVVYWQGRRFKNRDPKFWNPKSSKKSELVYQVGDYFKPRRAVIVESIINALTLASRLEERTIIFALLGKTLSESQLATVQMYFKTLEEIVIALDRDALPEAIEMARNLFGFAKKICIAKFPPGKDINAIGARFSWRRIKKAETFSKENYLAFRRRAS